MTGTRRELATAKAEETRERILDTALRLFREHGFDKATMRDIAAEAGVATGAAYYYFRSKEELVMAFYLRTSEQAREPFAAAIAATTDLRKRVHALIAIKFEQFAQHRNLLGALLRVGVDPRHPLSPFGAETKEVREESIAWFARAVEGADPKIPKDVAPYMPRLLWLYQMGMIFFWIIDESPEQRRSHRLLDGTLDLIVQAIRLSSLPLMGPLRKRVLKVLHSVEEDTPP